MKFFALLILFWLSLPAVFAQSGGLKEFMVKRTAKKEAIIAKGKPYLSPLAGPGYTPETGLLIAGGFLYTFKTKISDSLIQRSSVPLTAFISTKGNIGVNGRLVTFWKQDKLRVNIVAKYSDADNDYFGVGFATSNQIPQSDTTSRYHERTLYISPQVRVRILPNTYLGAHCTVSRTAIDDPNQLMQEDPFFLRYGADNFNNGLGFSLGYDSRDLTVNAYRGWYAKLTSTFFGEYLSSDNDYCIYEVDLRTYFKIQRPANTLALKLYGRFGDGNIPYSEMTLLGGGGALRGYIEGKYRDNSGIYFISEWRTMFLNTLCDPGKHGMALWIGSGSVATSASEIQEWIPNLGIGYRWEVQPRMNLRIDFGMGTESSGLYFGFTEAF